ncbi:MAG: glycosyltransferase family 2 protein [Chloroflexota bacterium]|nr:glycosyltransferase family 2 protein [Chloroflexota bacterium]
MSIVRPDPAATPLDTSAGDVALLHDDLVIASRQRAREPELPAATVAAALATAVSPPLARYAVVELPGPPDSERLAAEFGRRGHRVFSLVADADANDVVKEPDTGIVVVPFAAAELDLPRQEAAILTLLASVRRTAAIEAAVLLLRDPAWADVAVRARERWGWRIVADADAGTLGPRLERAAGVIVTNDSPSEPESPRPAALQERRGARHIARTAGWATIDAAIRAMFPLASVIIVNYETLAFTRLCLASLLANTEYPSYELILVDNGSTDGSAAEFERLSAYYPHVRAILNTTNLGFGPGNNQGLAIARGDLLVLLNSDTLVPPGWLSRLAHHLADPRLGLIGPATNRTCNEAQIVAPYETYGDFLRFARARAASHDGQRHAIRMPMMFCVAWRRDVLAEIGMLDERYETGMFEDEDYALRVKAAGYETGWAADTYVHHAYHASIGKLLPSGEYLPLFRRNQERFEEKWGICWERHRPPPAPPPEAIGA